MVSVFLHEQLRSGLSEHKVGKSGMCFRSLSECVVWKCGWRRRRATGTGNPRKVVFFPFKSP